MALNRFYCSVSWALPRSPVLKTPTPSLLKNSNRDGGLAWSLATQAWGRDHTRMRVILTVLQEVLYICTRSTLDSQVYFLVSFLTSSWSLFHHPGNRTVVALLTVAAFAGAAQTWGLSWGNWYHPQGSRQTPGSDCGSSCRPGAVHQASHTSRLYTVNTQLVGVGLVAMRKWAEDQRQRCNVLYNLRSSLSGQVAKS